ncbi:hypothetical protein ACFJIW_09250 [Tahibacter sp. UC22_41]|uniref:hypothetical protein n=1 Tax=Tahibacter sp. UC22_41 TaxID=3350178 RepID=UPI0036D9442F
MPLFRLVVALCLLPIACSAIAATPYEPLERQLTPEQQHATGLDTLSPAQLELLNRLLREKAEAGAATAAANTAAADGDVSATSRGTTASRELPPDLEIRTIKARLKGKVEGWAPGTEFRLDNGQTWKVLKGEITLRKPLESPEILVVPGLAGRWFLQVDEDYPKARVYRVD